METLSLGLVLNHDLAVRSAQCAAPNVRLRLAPCALPAARFAFVTYAVEIEGDTPLWFCTEAVDD